MSTSETESRPTAADDNDATATSAKGAALTATTGSDDPTATSATTDSTASVTAAAADATPTGGDTGDNPLDDLADITVELPNYSMRADGTLDLGEEGGPEAFVLDIQQSSAENYYFTVTIDEDLIEYWLVDETFYVSFDGTDTQSIPYTPGPLYDALPLQRRSLGRRDGGTRHAGQRCGRRGPRVVGRQRPHHHPRHR
jgi:hypothetical protein